jgi:exopolysaccharide biosynthesis polyprenyl glycosylphosphotransferase
VRRRFLISVAFSDLLVLVAAMVVGSIVTFSNPFPWMEPGVGGRIWPLLGLITGGLVGASWFTARAWSGSAPRPTYARAITIALTSLMTTTVGLFAFRDFYFSRPFVGWTMVTFLGGALAHRAFRRRRPWTERMILITNEKGLVDDLRNTPHAEVEGLLDPATESEVPQLPAGTMLAVDLRSVLSDRMAQYVSSCTLAGLDVRAMSSVYEQHTGRLPIVHLAEGWELSTPVLKSTPYLPGKRIFDLLAVAATAPMTLLLSGIIAVAVRLGSPGPVIFRQTRVGRNGELFTLYKFRTMVADAEKLGPSFATPDDDRLTAVGKWLRRFRADELPQLWNVVKGDLSLVGPRPEQVPFVRAFSDSIPFYSHRHLVRPGVTGWAQVNYGYADDQADTIDKLTYDLYYVKHMSPWLDLTVLGRSVWTVLSGFGAR